MQFRHLIYTGPIDEYFDYRFGKLPYRSLKFEHKQLEQEQRYARFNDTPYALEPNCKESPGGLRDLQIILWVAKAAGLGRSWDELARKGLATPLEARQIKANEALLTLIRARLHLLANRREDRLVFDLQTAVAESFGFKAQVPAVITPGGPGPPAGEHAVGQGQAGYVKVGSDAHRVAPRGVEPGDGLPLGIQHHFHGVAIYGNVGGFGVGGGVNYFHTHAIVIGYIGAAIG